MATKTTKKALSSYDDLLKESDLSQAIEYSMTHSFHENDLMDHAAFGLGIVIRTLAAQKIEVLFPSGIRVLTHGN